MDKFERSGRTIFGIGILGLSVLCFINGDFIVGRPPAWPETWHLTPLLGYVAGAISLVASICMILGWRAGLSSLVVGIAILLLSVLRHLPAFMNDWLNAFKAMALMAGAVIISKSFYDENTAGLPRLFQSVTRRKNIVAICTILLSVFFLASGYAHFKFVDFVKDFIPSYIPFRFFWAYACGIFLIAGGIGILLPPTRRLAALLSGVMLLGWFLLLHVPRLIADSSSVSDRMGFWESFAFSGIFFVLAGMFGKK